MNLKGTLTAVPTRIAAGNIHQGSQSPDCLSSTFAGLKPPLIVLGMHRSGTSMVVGMLQLLGVYLDPDLMPGGQSELIPGDRARTDGYGEAVAFRLANEAVMRRAGSDWQHVDRFLSVRDRPNFASASVRQLVAASNSSLKTGFLDRYPGGSPAEWGWKDPRNSLTLPYWLTIFPQARLLHVRRDTQAVVNSLMRRTAESAEAAHNAGPSRVERLRNAAANPAIIVSSLRRRLGLSKPVGPMTADDWRRLADLYVGECVRYREHAPGYLEVSYESILNEPAALAERISLFAGIDVTAARMRDAAAFVDRKPKPNIST